MKLYNTLSRKLEELKPLNPPEVTIYTCGPTVYQEPHIGNWRTFIFYDTLVRSLSFSGYEPKHVLNITDVGHLTSDADEGEDKLLTQARRERKTAWEVAEEYIELFEEGLTKLNIVRPKYLPRATKHISQQIELVGELERKGFTYKLDDGIYFDTARFKDYGKLAGIRAEGQMAGARVKTAEGKRHPTDFALWKFSPPDTKRDMEWESPWGKGFPGWHLECSAMAIEYLGETIDIHAGGTDHIGVHHPNEIAQSEASTGKQFAKLWLHGEMMLVNGQKMSKSFGNVYLLRDIEKKADLMAFRLLMLSSQYRSHQNFTWEALAGAQENLFDIYALCDRQFSLTQTDPAPELANKISALTIRFRRAVEDDLNLPEALAALNEFTDQTSLLPLTEQDLKPFLELLAQLDQVLGLGLSDRGDLKAEQKKLFEDRQKARDSGNFSKSDELRQKLLGQGIQIEDTPSGPRWRRTHSRG